MDLNVDKWGNFRIGDLFRLEPTKGTTTEILEDGNDIAYISAKHDLNGFERMVSSVGMDNYISKGNCIVFVLIGEGSCGYVNYVKNDFVGMSGKTCCGYLDGVMNESIGLFLETILCLERPKYSYGRSWTGNRLADTIIKLPVTAEGKPDWKFMEDYIKSLHSKKLTTKNKSQDAKKLDVKTWSKFFVKDYFKIIPGKYHSSEEYDLGNTPYYSASSENNGIGQYINLKPDFKGNCIVTGKIGCTAFYVPNGFCATSDVNVFVPKFEMNKYVGLFIANIINFNENYKWAYGRQCRVNDSNKISLKLPVTAEGKPDWEFMENYIKSLPYGDKI